jgi:tetratricopeptide (TPR) repeat protein
MLSARFLSGCSAVGLVLAGCLLISVGMCGQTPTGNAAAGATLSPDTQAKLDKLEADLKAAQDKGDAKTEAATLNQIGNLLFNFGDKQKALDSFNQALPLFRATGDSADEAYTLVFMGNTHFALGEPQKALDDFN